MTINEDKLAYFRSQLSVSDGTLPDLEWQWLRTKVADPNRGSIPDMWFYYLNKVLGYAGSIGDMLPNLGYALSASATGGGVFSPLSLGASALAWWSADRASTLTLSGSTVTTWSDVINGYAPTQATAGAKPGYSSTAFGGNPCLTFNGTTQYLTMASQPLPSGATPVEIWCVLSQDVAAADATTRRWFGYGGVSNNDTIQGFRTGVTGANRADLLIGNGSSALGTVRPNVDFSGMHVARIVVTQTTAVVYIDGLSGPTLSVVPAIGTSRVTIGGVLTGAGLWNGKIRDIVVTAPLTDQQTFSMWQWSLNQSTLGASVTDRFIWMDGDSYSTIINNDGIASRLFTNNRVVSVRGIGGSALADAVANSSSTLD